MEEQITNLAITNPNKGWVAKELAKLIDEWITWQKEVDEIQDYTYDPNIRLNVFADGEENIQKHEILQAKTLTFLNNNINGHGFIKGFDGKGCDRTDLRLKVRVKHRLHELRILQSCLEYAEVPESFWKRKGKELVEKISNLPADVAAQVASEWLKNPLS
ncbi:MAG: hypothetical protein PHU49_03590 [Syntrophorhabdaceae bacterium]|nr:hypothetical protein [Syntrophorhabdaceae bacterium]MDD5243078.1 hypothetical protein [Syntrophorhabdaceae bacterium]